MWAYGDARLAVRDVLRLSRAMTLKAAVADLPLGGGKGAIMVPPNVRLSPHQRRAALLDFGDLVESVEGRYITAEDVGTSSRDMSVIAQRTTHVAGLARSRGGSGDPSPFTALGVEVSIRAACERVFGDSSLRGRRICVLGLGHVGSRVAKRCARAGARLIVTDVDESRRAVGDQLGATWAAPEIAAQSAVDVLAPCALGGLLNDETVPRLRCRVIAGAANNQLATEDVADQLHERGILWAPDFVANAGGLINIAAEQGGYDPAVARRRVTGIADTLTEIFDRCATTGQTPLAAAMDLAGRRLADRPQASPESTASPAAARRA
jgi:leucine dehydrogenase